jgi:hypothetical protein
MILLPVILVHPVNEFSSVRSENEAYKTNIITCRACSPNRPWKRVPARLTKIPVHRGVAPYVINMLLMFSPLKREPHGP